MRYEFSNHPTKEGWFVVTDTKWMLECEFAQHQFNETQTFTSMGVLEDKADPIAIAKAMRELGEWLYTHHAFEAMPQTTYELRLSEDGSELHVIRRKEPFMDAVFETDDLPAIADALAKAAEFIRKRKGGKR